MSYPFSAAIYVSLELAISDWLASFKLTDLPAVPLRKEFQDCSIPSEPWLSAPTKPISVDASVP